MKIGFTGTQFGMTDAQKAALQKLLTGKDGEFHHGDCEGADAEAHDIARVCGLRIIGHPPSDPKKRARKFVDEWREEKPYLARNKDIVSETEVLVAAPAQGVEQLRSGTWSTVRFARKLRRKIVLIATNGAYVDGAS